MLRQLIPCRSPPVVQMKEFLRSKGRMELLEVWPYLLKCPSRRGVICRVQWTERLETEEESVSGHSSS